MGDFRQLGVWQKSHELALKVYEATAVFPQSEQFALTSQVRRAAISIGANIAEGCGRNGDAELARFLRIALGSASELEYELLLAHDLKYVSDAAHAELSKLVDEVKKMTPALIRSLDGRRFD